jgi:hypothetical protein
MSIIDAGRDAAARLLLKDRCTISRPGSKTFNTGTGTYDTTSTVIGTDLPCNLTPFTGAGNLQEQLAGEAVTTHRYQLSLAWDSPTVLKEDIVTLTDSEDPNLAGRIYRVEAPLHETFQIARRVVVEEILATLEEES